MRLRAEDILIHFEQMQRLVKSTETNLPCDVLQIDPRRQPTELLNAFLSFKTSSQPLRKQLLVDYQDHWIVLDVEKKEDGRLSLITLDAANHVLKLTGLMFLLTQICESIKLDFDLIHVSSLNEPLQRDKNSCPIFAWELLRWASELPELHTFLETKVLSKTASKNHIQIFSDILKRESLPKPMLLGLFNIKWVDYTSLMDDDIMSDFFMNTHTLNNIPACVQGKIDKWLIETPHPRTGEYALHNIRSSYCYHKMKVTLGLEEPLSENDFILREICLLHHEEISALGKVLRNAIAEKRGYQVRSLLQISDVNVNELPPSRLTALDRANRLRPSQSKDMIIGLLREKGASSGAALNGMFPAPAKEAQETVAESSLKAV